MEEVAADAAAVRAVFFRRVAAAQVAWAVQQRRCRPLAVAAARAFESSLRRCERRAPSCAEVACALADAGPRAEERA
eukprot:7935932-Lingulodinium_polyedra.AAC.1